MTSWEGVELATMKRALEVYVERAFGANEIGRRIPESLSRAETPELFLQQFHVDQRAGRMRRFALRMGNPRYPFMKVVFQELLIRGRFFFSVDTHDELDLKDSFPDYDSWLDVKRFNASLKEEVEQAWGAAGVPTFAAIVAEVERDAPPPPVTDPGVPRPRVLIVDDERSIARGVAAILSSHGYRISQVHTGEDAWDLLKRDAPDLVLSDLEMPGMSGLDLAKLIRADPDLCEVPFILATAAFVTPDHFHVIDGFLVKPYEAPVLLKFVAEHILRRDSNPSHPPGPASEESP